LGTPVSWQLTVPEVIVHVAEVVVPLPPDARYRVTM
jgi:hypothetical protein